MNKGTYIHLGQNVVVLKNTIIGIFDLDNTTGSHITRAFLSGAEKAGRVVNIAEDIPKSFVLCNEDGKTAIYLSQLSTATLSKRGESVFFD